MTRLLLCACVCATLISTGCNRAAAKAVTKWASRADTALTAYERYQKVTATRGAKHNFPFAASTVAPVSAQTFLVNASTGVFAQPNNYGGFSFYDRTGRPLGFSAWNHQLNEERYFHPNGVGM